jgi:protocatechuate 3,4-dioxygenase beta subunit
MTLSRRTILFASAAAMATLAAAVGVVQRLAGPARRTLTVAEKQTCALTIEAVEGPYWVSGMAETTNGNVNASGLAGVVVEVSGHVFNGLDDNKPIANAEVEVWHADSTGNYNPNGNGPVGNYKPADIALRGFVKTNAAGEYRFTTIYPGEYTGRARHFHFKIRAAGKSELTTQLIVPARPGDTLRFDNDDIAEGLPNCQHLVVDETASPAKARFDFRL